MRKPHKYWTEENTIKELKIIINKINHFPAHNELCKIKKSNLARAIIKNGGYNYFREKMGYKVIKQSPEYWTEENTIKELNEVIKDIKHFPTQKELNKMKKSSLIYAMLKNGGFNYFRSKTGYEIIKQDKKYWNEKNILEELKIIVNKIGHFPVQSELHKMKRFDLSVAITRNGGHLHFRELLKIPVSIQEKHTSELMSYIGKRGKASEDIVYKILFEYCKINDLPLPDLNVKLNKGNILEFVCNIGKIIGIDVTNTNASKHSAITTISRKWRKKDYHLYLDELWIVVFTDVLTLEDYNKLNSNSPENIKVFSIEEFLAELDYSAEQNIKNKINKFKACSFHTKEEMKGLNT